MNKYPDVLLHIDGEWRAGRTGTNLPVHDPATGQRIGSVAVAEREDLDAALTAAARGFELWRRVPAVQRAKHMHEAARLLRERADTVARLLTLENGKPLSEAQAEVRFGADIIDWFAEEGMRVAGRIVAPRGEGQIAQVFKEPVGPVVRSLPRRLRKRPRRPQNWCASSSMPASRPACWAWCTVSPT
jgi:succinate-semialdehyde dehydrogenase/glutarate-semialdehyde dehydrogenase